MLRGLIREELQLDYSLGLLQGSLKPENPISLNTICGIEFTRYKFRTHPSRFHDRNLKERALESYDTPLGRARVTILTLS
jgi:hypothetical protein